MKNRSFYHFLKFLVVVAGFLLGGGTFNLAQAANNSQKEILENLESILQQNRSRLQEIDRKLRETVSKASQSQISQGAKPLLAAQSTIDDLIEQRSEHLLRQDFIDRLKFYVDSRYSGGELRSFLSSTLKAMTLAEATSQESSKEMLLFLTYLSVLVQNIPQHQADAIEFIEGYMKTSSIRHPLRPDEYLERDNYTNGTITRTAKPAKAEEIGEMVEAKLNLLEAENAHRQSQKVFELRRPILKDVHQSIQEKTLVPDTPTL